MKRLLEILPKKEVLYEMPDEVFTIFYDLVKKTIAIKANMYFHGIYENLPDELRVKITVTETPRPQNDITTIELISIHREEVSTNDEGLN